MYILALPPFLEGNAHDPPLPPVGSLLGAANMVDVGCAGAVRATVAVGLVVATGSADVAGTGSGVGVRFAPVTLGSSNKSVVKT